MEYKHPNAKKKIGLVGKGVTFDTGGISIKPSNNMYLMKSDMGGAAAVLGTMELVAKLKLPVHLIGIVPATENMVDGAGTRPGDVIDSYSGKTIEVIDTDAEGRLVLADGLAYMKKQFNPDVMIDLATLTGNVVTSLGFNAAGLFSNNDELSVALTKAGEVTGERLWHKIAHKTMKVFQNAVVCRIAKSIQLFVFPSAAHILIVYGLRQVHILWKSKYKTPF